MNFLCAFLDMEAVGQNCQSPSRWFTTSIVQAVCHPYQQNQQQQHQDGEKPGEKAQLFLVIGKFSFHPYKMVSKYLVSPAAPFGSQNLLL